ncbi:MAG TPA: chromosome partitioning protein ParB [Gammaproteobacteria bacterium]|nr:chromosome partitioning protein ParB [Gammaproteobacteria bacterium]
MVTKKRLGRGIDELIPRDRPVVTDSGLEEIPIELIQPGRYQPRSHFDPAAISQLAESIRSRGLMQPIVLRALEADRYEIIAGERRWRAAQLVGMEKITAIIRNVDDEAVLAMSLIENIQREDLNPLEEANALRRLTDEFQLTHEEIAKAVGKSRSTVTNMLRLCSLHPRVASMLQAGEIDMGHARALLTLDDERQVDVAQEIVRLGLNVRQTEVFVSELTKPKQSKKIRTNDADTLRLEENLSQRLGQPVQIRHSVKGNGKLIIAYNNLDELDGVLEKIGFKE